MVDLKSGEIISLAFANGKKHDFQLFKDSHIHARAETTLEADTGYQGLSQMHANSLLPKNRSKNHPLSKQQRKENHEISKNRTPDTESKTYGDAAFTKTPTVVTDPANTAVNITYSAGTEGVVSVTPTTGEVTILKAGSTTITATAKIGNGGTADSEKAASYTLTVGQATPPAMEMDLGGNPVAASITTVPVTVTITGDRIADNAMPVVTYKGAKIELTTEDSKTYTGTATIGENTSETDEVEHAFTLTWSDTANYTEITNPVTQSITQQAKNAPPVVSGVTVTGPATVKVGEEKELTAEIIMSDRTPYTGEVEWNVNGTAAELVDGNKIKGVAEGEVTVTVTAGEVTSDSYPMSTT